MAVSYDKLMISPEYYTDPAPIADLIKKVDLVSLQVTRLRTLAVQLKSQVELVERQIEVMENVRKQLG